MFSKIFASIRWPRLLSYCLLIVSCQTQRSDSEVNSGYVEPKVPADDALLTCKVSSMSIDRSEITYFTMTIKRTRFPGPGESGVPVSVTISKRVSDKKGNELEKVNIFDGYPREGHLFYGDQPKCKDSTYDTKTIFARVSYQKGTECDLVVVDKAGEENPGIGGTLSTLWWDDFKPEKDITLKMHCEH